MNEALQAQARAAQERADALEEASANHQEQLMQARERIGKTVAVAVQAH